MSDSKQLVPWYKEGLRFKCTECGKCCTGAPGYVWVTDDEIVSLANTLKIPLELFKQKYIRTIDNRLSLIEKSNFDCIFLKDKKCTVYHARPKQCRTFPWWKQNLESEESWKRVAQSCEGINDKAPLISSSEIDKASS